jgi:hypothetical protein
MISSAFSFSISLKSIWGSLLVIGIEPLYKEKWTNTSTKTVTICRAERD